MGLPKRGFRKYVVVSLGCNSKPDDWKCSTHKKWVHNEILLKKSTL